MNTFTFNTKETYLAWRKQWKQDYRDFCKLIRDTKNDIKNQHREKGYAEYSTWSKLHRARIDILRHMEILPFAKQEAQRQYLAQKQHEAEPVQLSFTQRLRSYIMN